MVGEVALLLATDIHGVVAAALRRERTDALRRYEFLGADVEHALALFHVEGREVEGNGKELVGAHAPIHHLSVHIVKQVAVFVEEHLLKRAGRLLSLGCELRRKRLVLFAAIFGKYLFVEFECVVPQCVELNDVSRARGDWAAIALRVHPRHGAVATVGVEQSIVMQEEVGVLAVANELYHLAQQVAVKFVALLTGNIFAILLYTPDCPKQRVGLLHFVDGHGERLLIDVAADSLRGSLHIFLVHLDLADGKRDARHGDKHVTGATLEPRIAGKEIVLAVLLHLKLVGGVDEAVIEAVTAVEGGYFGVHEFAHLPRRNRCERSSEDDAIALLDRHFKITWYHEVFGRIIAALTLFRVIETAVPVGLMMPFCLMVELHVKVRITLIETHADTVFHGFEARVGSPVLVRPLPYAAESEERLEAQGRGRMGIEQGVADVETEGGGIVGNFLFQQHAAYAIHPSGHFLPLETYYILVTLRAIILALILMQSEVELCAVLDNRFVE